jgi:hypothetical protein
MLVRQISATRPLSKNSHLRPSERCSGGRFILEDVRWHTTQITPGNRFAGAFARPERHQHAGRYRQPGEVATDGADRRRSRTARSRFWQGAAKGDARQRANAIRGDLARIHRSTPGCRHRRAAAGAAAAELGLRSLRRPRRFRPAIAPCLTTRRSSMGPSRRTNDRPSGAGTRRRITRDNSHRHLRSRYGKG